MKKIVLYSCAFKSQEEFEDVVKDIALKELGVEKVYGIDRQITFLTTVPTRAPKIVGTNKAMESCVVKSCDGKECHIEFDGSNGLTEENFKLKHKGLGKILWCYDGKEAKKIEG
jgi:hypothetical protein